MHVTSNFSCSIYNLTNYFVEDFLRSFYTIRYQNDNTSFLSFFELQVAQEYSECPSGKKGGDLGWFPRGKMAGPFQEVAFNTPVGAVSAPFKST